MVKFKHGCPIFIIIAVPVYAFLSCKRTRDSTEVTPDQRPTDILCSEAGLLSNLDTTKATGPDGISALMLGKKTVSAMASKTSIHLPYLNLTVYRSHMLPCFTVLLAVVPTEGTKCSTLFTPTKKCPVSYILCVKVINSKGCLSGIAAPVMQT